jgi:hypothetical protein
MAAEYIRAVIEQGPVSYDTLCRAVTGASLIEPDRYITEETTRSQVTCGAADLTNYAAWLVERYINHSFIRNTQPGTFRFAFQRYKHRDGIYLSNRKERYIIRPDAGKYRICYWTRRKDDERGFFDDSLYDILHTVKEAPPDVFEFDTERMHVIATVAEVVRVLTEL